MRLVIFGIYDCLLRFLKIKLLFLFLQEYLNGKINLLNTLLVAMYEKCLLENPIRQLVTIHDHALKQLIMYFKLREETAMLTRRFFFCINVFFFFWKEIFSFMKQISLYFTIDMLSFPVLSPFTLNSKIFTC